MCNLTAPRRQQRTDAPLVLCLPIASASNRGTTSSICKKEYARRAGGLISWTAVLAISGHSQRVNFWAESGPFVPKAALRKQLIR
jgi:hypothetical protein